MAHLNFADKVVVEPGAVGLALGVDHELVQLRHRERLAHPAGAQLRLEQEARVDVDDHLGRRRQVDVEQRQALRSFHISEEFQDRFGYPELTKEIKHKILGLNGARLYGVDPLGARCDFTRRELERLRRQLPGKNRTLGPATAGDAAAFRTLDHEAVSTS
jgi:hypothetical protein